MVAKICILAAKERIHNLNDKILCLFYLNFAAFTIENEIEFRLLTISFFQFALLEREWPKKETCQQPKLNFIFDSKGSKIQIEKT